MVERQQGCNCQTKKNKRRLGWETPENCVADSTAE